MAKSKKKKQLPVKPVRQRKFGKYLFNSIVRKDGSSGRWWKCGRLELWAWAGYMEKPGSEFAQVWTKTWIFQYKGVIVEELLEEHWEKPFTTLGNKLAAGGFDKIMKQIDEMKQNDETAVCGYMEINEKPLSERKLIRTHEIREYTTGFQVVRLRKGEV